MDSKQLKEHLNNRPPGKVPDPELYKKMMDGLSGKSSKLPDYLESLTQNAIPAFHLLKKELESLQMPKRKKDFMYKGRQCAIEQLNDGRIILKFNALDESDSFYDTPLIHTAKELKDTTRVSYFKGHADAKAEFKLLPWYKRLFCK